MILKKQFSGSDFIKNIKHYAAKSISLCCIEPEQSIIKMNSSPKLSVFEMSLE